MKIKSLYAAGLFVGAGFLAASLLLLYVADGGLPIYMASGIFFVVAILCLHFALAARRARRQIRTRVPWDDIRAARERTKKAYRRNTAVSLALAGILVAGMGSLFLAVSCGSSGMSIEYFLFASPFLACGAIMVYNAVRMLAMPEGRHRH